MQVVQRDEERLANPEPRIGVSACSERDCRMLIALRIRELSFTLVQCHAAFFAYRHVLEQLQQRNEVPFLDELLLKPSVIGSSVAPKYKSAEPNYSQSDVEPPSSRLYELASHVRMAILSKQPNAVRQYIRSPALDKMSLDESQLKALHHALTSRVALIQGPPGQTTSSRRHCHHVCRLRSYLHRLSCRL
jgi:hypothetical protein